MRFPPTFRFRNTPSSQGFTLIEMLVVIAILAILIGLVTPSLVKARKSAKRIACASNIRACASGLYMYAMENGTQMPDGFNPTDGTWDKLLVDQGFLVPKVLRCPGDRIARQPQYKDLQPRTYVVNAQIVPHTPGFETMNEDINGYLDRMQRDWSQVVLLYERPSAANMHTMRWGIGFPSPYAYPIEGTGPNPNRCHDTGANWAFADMHVEYLNFMYMAPSDSNLAGGLFGAKYFRVKD